MVACGALIALAGCEPVLNVTIRQSDWVASAFQAEWDGPAGEATLWVADAESSEPTWTAWASATVEAGPSGLPIALLPVGREYSVRVELQAEDGVVWPSEPDLVSIPDVPDTLGNPHLELVDLERSELAAGGLTLTHRYSGARSPAEALSFVVDGAGEVVWWMDADPAGHRVVRGRPGRDLRSLLVLETENGEGEDFIRRVALDGELAVDTITPDVSHDFHENADGTLTWIGYERTASGFITEVPYPVVSDVLVTAPEGEADASRHETGFSFLDDYPAEPEIRCDHQEPGDFVAGAVEWTHANSIVRAPAGDGFLLMTRSLDALLMIDDKGARVWQVGGDEATLAPNSPEALFQHAHFSEAWLDDGGAVHLLIFDNGNHRAEPITSRVIELRVDPALGTYDLLWELPDPDARFSSFLGDAQRLPGGNTLVTWTQHGEIAEYTPEGEVVWKLVGEEGYGRVNWVVGLEL